MELNKYYKLVCANGLYTNQRNLKNHLKFVYEGVDLKGVRLLDIGGGEGIMALYASMKGANHVVNLEPEASGSRGVETPFDTFEKMKKELGIKNDKAVFRTDLFQDYVSEDKFDVIVLNNSINHLDEENCIILKESKEAQVEYTKLFAQIRNLLTPGGKLIITDCAQTNLWYSIGVKNPFMPMIEWEKHQNPSVWIKLLKKSGYRNYIIDWTSPNFLGTIGRILFGNRIVAFFLFNHFKINSQG